jgi:hypothetical protein
MGFSAVKGWPKTKERDSVANRCEVAGVGEKVED